MVGIYIKLRSLLNDREIRNSKLLFLLMLLMGVTEVMGVVSIMPLLTVISTPDIISSNVFLRNLYSMSGAKTPHDFTVLLGVFSIVAVLTGMVVKSLTFWALARFAHMRNYSLSSRLINIYLSHSYSWFLDRNSAELGKKILSEVQIVVDQVLIPLLRLIANVVILLFLVMLLILINPFIALASALFLGGIYTLLYVFLRNYISRIGQERIVANNERFKIASEALGGFKQVKISGIEKEYVSAYQKPSYKYAERLAISQALGEVPRFLLEAVAIAGMILVILFLLIDANGELQKVIPVVGAYAFAGMRILPAMQQVFQNSSRLRFGKSSLDALYEDYIEARQDVVSSVGRTQNSDCNITLNEKITLENVCFSYRNDQENIINDICLSIKANTSVAFIGSTGAGKTTLVDLIAGLLTPSSGGVFVDNIEINSSNSRGWQKIIGYIPQYVYLVDDTVYANIAFGVKPDDIDKEAVIQAAKMAEIHDFICEDLSNGYDTEVGDRGVRLSGGQSQRIGIARALYRNPDVLVLDEATSSLDVATESAVMDSVYKQKKSRTIIMIAHRLSTVENCDQIYFLEKGRVIDVGKFDELLERSEKFRELARKSKQH